MVMFKALNLLLAFLLELGLLVIFGYWGVAVPQSPVQKIALGAGLPVLLAVIWGIFLAPNSTTRLGEPWLLIAKLMIFSLAALALFSIGKQTQAVWFAGITLINLVLLYI